MDSMVEQVAKAICNVLSPYEYQEPCDCPNGVICRTMREMAEAAIKAMREPTKAMVVAGCRHENMGDMEGRWQAMVDAALENGHG